MKFELKENEKERSREKEKENSSTSTTKDRMNSGKDPLPPVRMPFSAALLRDAARRIGMPSDEVRGWCEYMNQVGWRFATGGFVDGSNFRRSLRMWHKVAARELAPFRPSYSSVSFLRAAKETARENAQARLKAEAQKRRDELAATEEGWVLCAEECAHCDGVGCACGIKIPPAHQSWPKPPRECPAFKAKEVS